LDRRLPADLQTVADQSQGEGLEARPRHRQLSHHAPRFDGRHSLFPMTGVELMPIDGCRTGALALDRIAASGLDMKPWPPQKHCCSWLCLGPGNTQTGGRRRSGRTRNNASRAARICRLAAYSLTRSQTAWGAFYRRLKARLEPAKALTATAHQLAKIVSNRLRYGQAYVDRGAAYDDQPYRERVRKHLQRRAQQMGFELVPVRLTSAAAE
jgi:transposase